MWFVVLFTFYTLPLLLFYFTYSTLLYFNFPFTYSWAFGLFVLFDFVWLVRSVNISGVSVIEGSIAHL